MYHLQQQKKKHRSNDENKCNFLVQLIGTPGDVDIVKIDNAVLGGCVMNTPIHRHCRDKHRQINRTMTV